MKCGEPLVIPVPRVGFMYKLTCLLKRPKGKVEPAYEEAEGRIVRWRAECGVCKRGYAFGYGGEKDWEQYRESGPAAIGIGQCPRCFSVWCGCSADSITVAAGFRGPWLDQVVPPVNRFHSAYLVKGGGEELRKWVHMLGLVRRFKMNPQMSEVYMAFYKGKGRRGARMVLKRTADSEWSLVVWAFGSAKDVQIAKGMDSIIAYQLEHKLDYDAFLRHALDNK